MSACASGGQPGGLSGGRLAPCPATPNCVCSEGGGGPAFIEPIAFSGPPEALWEAAKSAVTHAGGRVETEAGDYLAATFRSRVFGFVDDLELRMDREAKRLHVRSAARTGAYDFGVNRRRAEALREALRGR